MAQEFFPIAKAYTQAQIDAGEANNQPGVRLVVVDASGFPTGQILEGQPNAAPLVLAAAVQAALDAKQHIFIHLSTVAGDLDVDTYTQQGLHIPGDNLANPTNGAGAHRRWSVEVIRPTGVVTSLIQIWRSQAVTTGDLRIAMRQSLNSGTTWGQWSHNAVVGVETFAGWSIGGVPVYMRRFTGNAPTNVDVVLFNPGSASRLVDVKGWIMRLLPNQRHPIMAVEPQTGNAHAGAVFQTPTGEIRLFIAHGDYNGQEYDFTVFYTNG